MLLKYRLSLGGMQEGVILNVCCVICVLCYVMCYVIKTLGNKELMTMNNRMTILGKDPRFGLSILRSKSKILETD